MHGSVILMYILYLFDCLRSRTTPDCTYEDSSRLNPQPVTNPNAAHHSECYSLIYTVYLPYIYRKYIYLYVYIYIIYFIYKYIYYKYNIFFLNIYMHVCVFVMCMFLLSSCFALFGFIPVPINL